MQQSLTESSPVVGNLIVSNLCVDPATKVQDVVERFFMSPDIDAVAVVEGKEPIGLVTRPKLLFSVFRRYGFELYGRKPIVTIADTDPLCLDDKERLDVAIDRALARPPQDVYDEIIVTDPRGFYKGLIPIRQMIIQQSNVLANSIVQREIAHERAKEFEKVNHIKSQFIANVTHELRSPVNVIIGLAELMKIACEKGHVDQVRNRLNLMMSGATHLRAIITNILDLSKIEAGKMEIICEDFDVLGIVTEVAETTRVLVGSKPVQVVVENDSGALIMRSDPIKVKQILTNLMSNAAKFTERGRITLTVHVSGNKVLLRVKDTGPGIEQNDIDRLFLAFSQVGDVATKKHEGTGLGLTITKNLTDMLGGKITLESEFGTGTMFEVLLPLIHHHSQGKENTHEQPEENPRH